MYTDSKNTVICVLKKKVTLRRNIWENWCLWEICYMWGSCNFSEIHYMWDFHNLTEIWNLWDFLNSEIIKLVSMPNIAKHVYKPNSEQLFEYNMWKTTYVKKD